MSQTPLKGGVGANIVSISIFENECSHRPIIVATPGYCPDPGMFRCG
jgi:hypothetical protein